MGKSDMKEMIGKIKLKCIFWKRRKIYENKKQNSKKY
jgi:hypothetical protein